jgi:hypothetical protein
VPGAPIYLPPTFFWWWYAYDASVRERVKFIIGGSVGNMLERYDWFI